MLLRVHGDGMARFGEGPACNIGAEFCEGGDAILLEPVIFFGEVAVDLGVAGHVAAVLAQDIFREVLCVAAGAAPIDQRRISKRELMAVATSTGTTSISTAKVPAS